jgi:hypothetical protein
MPQKTLQELEETIQKAIKKVKARKENDLCKYLPGDKGGYIHHFTMRKMKTEAPEVLKKMINERINDPNMPKRLAPRPRAARGSRKRRDQIVLTRPMLERILNVARLVGDKEMITMLSPKRPTATLKKELITSIRQNKADNELWSAWTEAVGSDV